MYIEFINMNMKSVVFFTKLFLRNIKNGKLNFLKIKALAKNVVYAVLRKPEVKYGPQALWIEAANFCNLECEGCWVPAISQKMTHRVMDFDLYKKIVDDISDTAILIMLQMSGESFLNKHMLDMMEYAHRKKIIVWTSTNGSFLTSDDWGEKIVQSGIDTLYFSISGTNQQEYEKYHRKGNLEYVIDNIKKIQKAKDKLCSKTPYLVSRILITDDNNLSLQKSRQFCKDLGIGMHVRYVYLEYIFDGLDDPKKNKIKVTSSCEPGKINNHCMGLWLSAAVQSNGIVLPCCLNQLGVPELGDVNRDRFNAIWKNDKFNEFRKAILSNRKTLGGCAYCDNSVGFRDSFSKERKVIKVNFYQ